MSVSWITLVNFSANDSLKETENDNPEDEEEHETYNVSDNCFYKFNGLSKSFLYFNDFKKFDHSDDDQEPVNEWLLHSHVKCDVIVNYFTMSMLSCQMVFSWNNYRWMIKWKDWNCWVRVPKWNVVIVKDVITPH